MSAEVIGNTLVAEFRKQELIDQSRGSTAKLNVTGNFCYDIPFAGSNMVKMTRSLSFASSLKNGGKGTSSSQ